MNEKVSTKALDYSMMGLSLIFGCGSLIMLFGAGSARYNFGWSESDILIWDAALSFLFFLQHSGMVRDSFRRRLASVAAPRYQGAIYSIASGIALLIVVLFWQRSGIELYRLAGILLWITRFLSLSAIVIFMLSIYSLQSFDMFGVGPIRAHLRGIQPQPGPFVVRGSYRWVRHPFYACILVLFWTVPVVTTDRLLFNILWTGWMYIGTLLEERDLLREFGEAYAEYQKRVPRFIPWRRPAEVVT